MNAPVLVKIDPNAAAIVLMNDLQQVLVKHHTELPMVVALAVMSQLVGSMAECIKSFPLDEVETVIARNIQSGREEVRNRPMPLRPKGMMQ